MRVRSRTCTHAHLGQADHLLTLSNQAPDVVGVLVKQLLVQLAQHLVQKGAILGREALQRLPQEVAHAVPRRLLDHCGRHAAHIVVEARIASLPH